MIAAVPDLASPDVASSARRHRAPPDALAAGCFHLAGLVGAGVPLVDALDEIAASEPRRARRALWHALGARVAGGAPLSVALGDAPRCFDAELVALCRAGEADGTLAEALGAMEATLAARADFVRRSRTALAYPAFAGLVLAATVLFLFGEVVPALDGAGFGPAGGTTGAAGAGAPWHARLLRAVAGAVSAWGIPIALAGAALWCGVRTACAVSPGVALRVDRLALRALPAARLRATLETARLAGTLARLHGRGAALPDALALAGTGLTRPALRGDVDAVRRRVVAGTSLGAALGDARHVPSTLARFARAGESAGALPAALERAAHVLERDALTALERAERLAGPALLCAVGAVLTWIVVSIVLPVYDAAIGAGLAS